MFRYIEVEIFKQNKTSKSNKKVWVPIYIVVITAWHPVTNIVRENMKIHIAAIGIAIDRNIQTTQSSIVADHVNVCISETLNNLWE